MVFIQKLIGVGLALLTCGWVVSCKKAPDPLPITFFDSTFETGADEWSGGAAGYKAGSEDMIKLNAGQAPMPAVLKSAFNGMKLEGNSPGDGFFLFLKRKVTGFDATKTYKVAYRINLASNLPDTTGGAGRIVYLKAGASSEEPDKSLSNGVYLPSIKLGAVAANGTEMLLLGNVANGLDSTSYRALTRDNASRAVVVKPNKNGEIWLCVGVNTTFKGNIALYFDRIYAAVGEKTIAP